MSRSICTPIAWAIGMLASHHTICVGLQINAETYYKSARELSRIDGGWLWLVASWTRAAQQVAARASLADRVLREVEP